jgi:hypothetical protein
MATCGVIGQGVGTAAAWAAANSLSLQKVLEEKNIRHVQDKLLDDDCFLPLISRHQKDIVLSAKIRASSQTQDGLAENVKTSLTRSTAGLLPGDNQEKYYWQADPESEMPQWLELEWHEAVSFNEIRIVFDSGLYRPLTLTHDKLSGMDEKMIWAAQPETISDYRIQYETSCGWKELIAVKGNYQRLNIHVFEQITANKLRLCFDKTNGSREVRVCRLSILRS